MNKSLCLIIIIAFICSTAFANSTADTLKLEFEESFSKYSKEIKTIKCDFTQEKEVAFLENKVTMNGIFYYNSNGDICLDYNQPKGDKIIFTDEQFMIEITGKKTIAKIKSNPMLRQLGGMLVACMTGNIKMFENGWTINYSQSKEEYILSLSPLDKRASKMISKIVLNFVKKDMSLSKMQMIENGNNKSTYRFHNKKFNTDIDPSVFDLKS